MDYNHKKIDALINLLEDEDRNVSTEAMEQLLAFDQEVDAVVAEFQEAQNPILRNRIHQLGNILTFRRSRDTFIEKVGNLSLTLWEGIIEINHQFNPSMDANEIEGNLSELALKLPPRLSIKDLAEFMRDEDFIYAAEDVFGVDLYLIEDVLIQRVAAPVLLSVVAMELAQRRQLKTHMVIFKGKHSLLDIENNLIKPSDNWSVTHFSQDTKLHFCGKKDIWLAILSQLFLASILEGRLLSIYRSGYILTRICGGDLRELPFPLGS